MCVPNWPCTFCLRYVNYTGADEATDCLRCPAGRFSAEEGAGLCHCITAWRCGAQGLCHA